jgi:SAM-dependent methyltransferase
MTATKIAPDAFSETAVSGSWPCFLTVEHVWPVLPQKERQRSLAGFNRGANMDWSTFKQRKRYRAAPLSLLLGVVGQMVWVALPPGSSFFTLEPEGTNRNYAVYAVQQDGDAPYVAPYVPTPQEVVDRMLELAEVRKGDFLYDLGSGDGRIVITAARRYGIKAIGFEIDPTLVKNSRASIREAGLEHLVEIRDEDIRTVDLSPASVLTLYLSRAANLRLRSAIMRQLKPGSRVVSHDFGMGNWTPDRIDQLTDSAGLSRTIYLWRIIETR